MSPGLLTRGAGVPVTEAMDPRLRARRVEVARDRGRRRLRAMAALAVVTALVVGAVAASRSPLLDVDAVRISGARHTGVDTTLDTAGITLGRSMTSVDPTAVEARIEELPWVAGAKVDRRWPDTISVRVTERAAVAVAGEGPGSVLVDRDGRILGLAVGDEQLPMAGPDPVEGPGGMLGASHRPVVRMLADLPPSLRADVERGVVSTGGLGLVLRDGIRVRFGDVTRLRAKSEAVEVLLAEADRGTIATIDVAVPDAAALTRERQEGA